MCADSNRRLSNQYPKAVQAAVCHAPSWLERAAAVFLVTVQQGAFVSVPLVVSGVPISQMRDVQQNPWNTASIMVSLALITLISVRLVPEIVALARANKASVFFTLYILLSATWSIHPTLTLRRGVGYVLTMLIAAYLVLRFRTVERMKVLSASFAITAMASLLFVCALPQYGIMQEDGGLAGAWRGVFTTKEQLGEVMAVAVFTEMFILALEKGRALLQRLALLGIFLLLVVLSHATTAVILCLVYVAGVGVHFLMRREQSKVVHVLAVIVLCMCSSFVVAWDNPQTMLKLIGKDSTLTGRTELWHSIVQLIGQRPYMGWGYRAMFQPNDASTAVIDRASNWGAGSSHNAFLEIALELGYAGLGAVLLIVAIAFRRSQSCFLEGHAAYGALLQMYIVGTLLGGITLETLGQNQNIGWVVFNVLLLGCSGLLRHRRLPPDLRSLSCLSDK